MRNEKFSVLDIGFSVIAVIVLLIFFYEMFFGK